MTELIRTHVKTILVLVAIVGILGLLTFARLSPSGIFSDLQNDLKSIEPNVNAAYTDLDGNPIDLKNFKGKPLVINSWATWIPFSQDELKMLIEIQGRYGEQVSVLAMNRKEDAVIIRSYLSTFGISTDQILILTDPTDNFYTAVGGYAMPETIVYRSDGTIALHKRGVLTVDELIVVLDGLVTE